MRVLVLQKSSLNVIVAQGTSMHRKSASLALHLGTLNTVPYKSGYTLTSAGGVIFESSRLKQTLVSRGCFLEISWHSGFSPVSGQGHLEWPRPPVDRARRAFCGGRWRLVLSFGISRFLCPSLCRFAVALGSSSASFGECLAVW